MSAIGKSVMNRTVMNKSEEKKLFLTPELRRELVLFAISLHSVELKY